MMTMSLNTMVIVIKTIFMFSIFETDMMKTSGYEIHVPGHFRFLHGDITSQDLLCPECCREVTNECVTNYVYSHFAKDRVTQCCIDRACPYWKFKKYSRLVGFYHHPLQYDNITRQYVINENMHNSYAYNHSFYDLNFTKRQLTSFPINMCDFPKTVLLNVSENYIDNITDLSCLKMLDTLDLSFNNIRVIRSTTFSSLTLLRNLYLKHNKISILEPGAFKYRPGSLNYVDFRNNSLIMVDVTNLALGYFFKKLDYSYNAISLVTNFLRWGGFKENEAIGGGQMILEYNNFTTAPNMSQLGFKDIQYIFRVKYNYRLLVKNNPWICDCHWFPYVEVIGLAKMYYKDIGIDGFVCESPPSLKGYPIQEFRKNTTLLQLFICNITMKDKCPPNCYCFNQPSQERVVINCSSTQRSNMPKVVPEFDNLDIDFSYNMIETFEGRNYLYRTKRIDMSYNRIIYIDPIVYSLKLLGYISLNNNQITTLDRSAQIMSPCNLFFGNLTLPKCSCQMRWIKIWLERQKAGKCSGFRNFITCKGMDIMADLSEIPDHMLCPVVERSNVVYTWLPVSMICTLGLAVFYYNFRHEIFLILRKTRLGFHPYNIKRKIIYDVYLSFNAENDDVRIWAVQILTKYLEKQEHTICLPPRDFSFAGIHADQIHQYITNSRSFVVVLSEDYFEHQSQNIEWNHIWNVYKTDPKCSLVIINFDLLTNNQIYHRKLKACIRLGYAYDFSNMDNRLMADIHKNIGATKK